MDKIKRLRQNDPEKTAQILWLYNFVEGNPGPIELADPLTANDHVNDLVLRMESIEDADWEPMLNAMENRENLLKVVFEGSRATAVVVPSPFLSSIQRNTAIRTVKLSYLILDGSAIAAFLDAALSLTSFTLDTCTMSATRREQDALQLAAALQRNTNISELGLLDLSNDVLLPILRCFGESVNVLRYIPLICSMESSLAIQSILESTATPLRRFELRGWRNYGREFLPLAQGLVNSKSVTDIVFRSCVFIGESMGLALESILQSKINLQSLSFHGCILFLLQHSIPSLLRPSSTLRSLTISGSLLVGYDFFDNLEDFVARLNDVEKSNLEFFGIGRIESNQQLQSLINSIPKMRVKGLEVHFLRSIFYRYNLHRPIIYGKADLIRAVKKNANLRTFSGMVGLRSFSGIVAMAGYDRWEQDETDLFSEADHDVLNSFSTRNECRVQWIAKPSIVPEGAWANALSSADATSTGPDTMFSILRAIAPFIGRRLEPPPYNGLGRSLEPPPEDGLAVGRPLAPPVCDELPENKRRRTMPAS